MTFASVRVGTGSVMNSEAYKVDIQQDYDLWNEKLPDNHAIVSSAVIAALKSHNIESAEVAVLLSDDTRVQGFNAEFRGKNTPTNVLSFPGFVINPDSIHEVLDHLEFPMIGDIIVSFDTILAEAGEQNKSLTDHLAHMIVHSTLHLIGYVHDNDDDAELMEEMEIDILESLDIDNPYKCKV